MTNDAAKGLQGLFLLLFFIMTLVAAFARDWLQAIFWLMWFKMSLPSGKGEKGDE